MTGDPDAADLRALVPRVLGRMVRRHGDFDACEDAVQDALLAATRQWPHEGVPENPLGWLLTVATRRLTDRYRSDRARARREMAAAALAPPEPHPGADAGTAAYDDTLLLFFLCCHPSLPAPSQAALTLRAVGGLTTAQIARCFLTTETTMKQRIGRAKRRITDDGTPFRPPSGDEWRDRLDVVLHALYLIFTEGYAATSGSRLRREDLVAEAIRLARELYRLLPHDGEVRGLLALMLLTDARRAARVGADGTPVPLDAQDRGRWDRAAIDEGTALLVDALSAGALGPYQVQAAIAAVHDEAPSADETDWPQVLGLYDVLGRIAPSPVVALNRAVAVAMVHGHRAALDLLADLAGDPRLARGHRLEAVRAHVLEMAGDTAAAHAAYLRAADRAGNLAERGYLTARARAVAPEGP